MKKNKRSRIFSRVLSRLAWAAFYHVNDEKENAYKEVLVAKRCIEDCGGENVKVAFYEREYHLQFTAYRYRDRLNRYYTVSASHGYVNDYHRTNRDEMRNRIGKAEFERDCKLRRDFYAYQWLQTVADNVLFEGLSAHEYDDYCQNGKISDIPFDTAVSLWRELRGCMEHIVDEAIAHKGVQI